MIAAPKATQAVFAALGDFYTWKLAEKVYGYGSNEAWATVCSFPISMESFLQESSASADARNPV